jgi:subtilisin-like proprotein convertase family protein
LNPDATEVCDGIDNDCDGITDPVFAQGSRSWYRDNDTDGFGDPEDSVVACARPDGYAANDDDCNDRVTAVNPDAVELCDTVDNNCDGVIDPATSADASTWYVDFDNDGAGDPASATIRACAQPEGYVGVAGDCDDDDDTLPGSGARTFALDTNLPVPPSGQSTGLTVARVPVDSGGVVQGVRVQVTVLHTDTGDITITLVSPLGTRVILARERGFDDNYTQTTFSDAASATISSSSNPFTGTWRPEQPLSAFIGQDAAGDWLLEVSDRFSLENGSIRRVRLDLELGCPAEP